VQCGVNARRRNGPLKAINTTLVWRGPVPRQYPVGAVSDVQTEAAGDMVEYETDIDPANGRLRAQNVRLI
jgi:hypothetical protein